jgi:hypothetical protein
MKIMSYSYKLLLCLLLLLSTNASKAIDGFSLIPAGAFTMGNSVAEDSRVESNGGLAPIPLLPLVKPDVRISRIRLSCKRSS